MLCATLLHFTACEYVIGYDWLRTTAAGQICRDHDYPELAFKHNFLLRISKS
jgi:hypothetical protein